MSIICGTENNTWKAYGGVRNPAAEPVDEHTIYDLASLTKLFTGLLVMRLSEEGIVDLRQQVTKYVPYMSGLSSLSVDQILGFETGLMTPQRVDAQPDAEHAMQTLLRIEPKSVGAGRSYSDMHAMVLRFVLEEAAQMSYCELLDSRILKPLQMTDTNCKPSDPARCVDYNLEHRIEKGVYIIRQNMRPGVVHDPKARILFPDGNGCAGHAGLFSTIQDIGKLAQGVLKKKIIGNASLMYMAKNRTGRRLDDGTWTQFLGCQCYVKHPELYHSQIPCYESHAAIGLSGFTGNHLSIDPERGIFTCFLGNRVMNRLSVIQMKPGETLEDYGLAPDGSGLFTWPDGTKIWSSVDYVHQKDRHFHNEVAKTLGLD